MRRKTLLLLLVAAAAVIGVLGTRVLLQEPQNVVRESRVVMVHGAQEIWQLVWDAKPSIVCGSDRVSSAITCPCSGFAYGEYGDLSLVRQRGGETERMPLSPLFGMFDGPDFDRTRGKAILQRWPLEADDLPREDRGDPTLVAVIMDRNERTLIEPADYDRDGSATEFLIQVGTLPCGKLQFAAIGVAPTSNRLHTLSSLAKPDEPLIMPAAAWSALRASAGPTAVTTWACGDHGADQRNVLVVSAVDGTIQVRERKYSCREDGNDEKLLDESDF